MLIFNITQPPGKGQDYKGFACSNQILEVILVQDEPTSPAATQNLIAPLLHSAPKRKRDCCTQSKLYPLWREHFVFSAGYLVSVYLSPAIMRCIMSREQLSYLGRTF